MIDYKDSQIVDILPYNLITPEARAISFAIAEEKRSFLRYSAATSLYADIDKIPEDILDLMALELNTQYYDQTLPRKKKERLISQTLLWYMHAGTPSILAEFLATILDGGYVEEWHTYGGNPYFFKAYARVSVDEMVPVNFGRDVIRRINLYKNARSWLESFAFILQTDARMEVKYESRLNMISNFFARNNRAFLLIDGSWFLDGTYRLNGYRTEDAEFYPVTLEMIGDFWAGAALEAGGCTVRTEEAVDIRTGTKFIIRSQMQKTVGLDEKMTFGNDVHMETQVNSFLRVEHDLWYLDGTYLLDGSKLLDAEIFDYVL